MNELLTLSVREKASRDGVPLDSFLTIAGGFSQVASEINDVINLDHKEKARAELVVVAARPGSIVMDMEVREEAPAAFDIAREVVGATLNGLSLLETEAVRPPYFSDRALQEAARLVRPLGDGIAEIRIARPNREVVLTQRVAEHVRAILNPRSGQITSVEGRLYRVNMGRRLVGVYDARLKQAITCIYPDYLFEEIKRHLGEDVRVFGKARTDANGVVQRMEMRRLQRMVAPEARRGLAELFGSDPDFTEDMDSVAYVRAHRGEQATNE